MAAFHRIATTFHQPPRLGDMLPEAFRPLRDLKGLGRNRQGRTARGDRKDRSGLPRTLDLDEAFQELFRFRVVCREPTQRVPRGLLVLPDAILHGGQDMRPKEVPHDRDITLGRLRPPAIGP